METIREVAVVFAKPAVSGRVKTRLGDDLGDEAATELYRSFLADTASYIADVVPEQGRVLAHPGSADHPSFEPFRQRGFEAVDQGEGDLGDRLRRGFDACFGAGAERVTALGADSPTLPARCLRNAFDVVSGDTDAALGPSFDGGYYLLALDRRQPDLFEQIPWSTSDVLATTLRRADASGLRCQLLEFWYDVDTFADLRRLQTHLVEYGAHLEQTPAPATRRSLDELARRGAWAVDSL